MKATRRLLAGGFAVAALAAVAIGAPANAAAPEKSPKISASVTVTKGSTTRCTVKWTGTNLSSNTLYQMGLFKGEQATETNYNTLMNSSDGLYVDSDSTSTTATGTAIRGAISTFEKTVSAGTTNFTAVLIVYASGDPLPIIARDITVANHCN